MENPGFSKAGVNILSVLSAVIRSVCNIDNLFSYYVADDCKKLWKDYGINVRNCVDLGLLARTVDNARWKGKYSEPIVLARLCETYNDLTLTKGKITRSNWEAVLSPQQQECMYNRAYHSVSTLTCHYYQMLRTTVILASQYTTI